MLLGKRSRCPKGYIRVAPGSDRCKPKGARVEPNGRDEYDLPEWRIKCDPGYHKIRRTRRCRKAPKKEKKVKPVIAAAVARPVVHPAAHGARDAARARSRRMREVSDIRNKKSQFMELMMIAASS